jgi:class 3 adenylate cyclase
MVGAGELNREVSAVLAMDVAGYGRLMELNEDATHTRLTQLRLEVIEPVIFGHAGHIVKNTGDGILARFDDVDSALHCAVEMQTAILSRQEHLDQDALILFRVGLNFCEIIRESYDIFGDGVNVAARLQAYAEPGDIAVTADALEAAGRMPEWSILDLGELRLKNHAKPVRAYSLRAAGRPRRVVRPEHGSPSQPTIAVLPFRTLAPKPEDSYFGDGIVEDIIRSLGSLRDLLVIARTSTLGLNPAELDLGRVGRELRVRYVLTGAVRRGGSELLISTQLWETDTSSLVWSNTYRGSVDDLFELQEHIALGVVANIAPQIRERELRRTLRKHPDSLDAYDFTLKGLDLLYRLDFESFSRARGLFQEAIALDPDYGAPYANAAMWHVLRVGQGWSEHFEFDASQATVLAAEAIERDKYDALGLAIYGHAQSWLHRRFDTGMAFLDRAVAACPSSAMAWCLSSCTCSYIGRGEAAIERGEHALRLSPLDQYAFWYTSALTLANYVNGSYDRAIQYGYQSHGHKPSYTANIRFLIVSLIAAGRIAEARTLAGELMSIEPQFSLRTYSSRCPLQAPHDVALFVSRLRQAGLPV